MEKNEVEYRIVPDVEDIQDVYDSLQMEMVSIRSDLSKTRRAMDINSAIEDCLMPLLTSLDCNGKVDIRPLLSKIAEENDELRKRAESLSLSLEKNKQKTRNVLKRTRQSAL